MSKIKIKLAVLGQSPSDFNINELVYWHSEVFEIIPTIESFQLNEDAQGPDWTFTDNQLEQYLRGNQECAFLIIFVKVKLEKNWYIRRLPNNRIVFTFYEMDQIVRFYGLPLKNLALRVLYAAVLIYKRYGDRIPPASEETNYAHDETRGCLFDMNANKLDIIDSLHHPCICERCCSQLKQTQVSNELLATVQNELRRIQQPLIDRIVRFIKEHTILSIALSFFFALVLGVIASLIASWIYEYL